MNIYIVKKEKIMIFLLVFTNPDAWLKKWQNQILKRVKAHAFIYLPEDWTKEYLLDLQRIVEDTAYVKGFDVM